MRPLAGLVVLATAVLAVPSARGATLVNSWEDCFRSCDDGLSVTGDKAANRIDVRIETTEVSPEAFLLAISGPVRQEHQYGDPCRQLAGRRWRCPYAVTDATVVGIKGRAGRDRIRVGDGVPQGAYLEGGAGRDKLVAGDANDDLNGGRGNDVERGGKGDDYLGSTGRHDRGRDAFYGGAGDDVIRAGDYRRDRRIRCGRGEDTAYIDPATDPGPRGCERIRYGL